MLNSFEDDEPSITESSEMFDAKDFQRADDLFAPEPASANPETRRRQLAAFDSLDIGQKSPGRYAVKSPAFGRETVPGAFDIEGSEAEALSLLDETHEIPAPAARSSSRPDLSSTIGAPRREGYVAPRRETSEEEYRRQQARAFDVAESRNAGSYRDVNVATERPFARALGKGLTLETRGARPDAFDIEGSEAEALSLLDDTREAPVPAARSSSRPDLASSIGAPRKEGYVAPSRESADAALFQERTRAFDAGKKRETSSYRAVNVDSESPFATRRPLENVRVKTQEAPEPAPEAVSPEDEERNAIDRARASVNNYLDAAIAGDRDAYKKLAFTLHPDRGGHLPAELRNSAENLNKKLSAVLNGAFTSPEETVRDLRDLEQAKEAFMGDWKAEESAAAKELPVYKRETATLSPAESAQRRLRDLRSEQAAIRTDMEDRSARFMKLYGVDLERATLGLLSWTEKAALRLRSGLRGISGNAADSVDAFQKAFEELNDRDLVLSGEIGTAERRIASHPEDRLLEGRQLSSDQQAAQDLEAEQQLSPVQQAAKNFEANGFSADRAREMAYDLVYNNRADTLLELVPTPEDKKAYTEEQSEKWWANLKPKADEKK